MLFLYRLLFHRGFVYIGEVGEIEVVKIVVDIGEGLNMVFERLWTWLNLMLRTTGRL